MIRFKVNGDEHVMMPGTIPYEEIIVMAGYDRSRIVSVTYKSKERNGILAPNTRVEVSEGMRFQVSDTSGA